MALAAAALGVRAQELRLRCYSDGNECEVTGEIVKRVEAANMGAKVVIDRVPCKAVVGQLPVQQAAGEWPAMARVTVDAPWDPLTPPAVPHSIDAAMQRSDAALGRPQAWWQLTEAVVHVETPAMRPAVLPLLDQHLRTRAIG